MKIIEDDDERVIGVSFRRSRDGCVERGPLINDPTRPSSSCAFISLPCHCGRPLLYVPRRWVIRRTTLRNYNLLLLLFLHEGWCQPASSSLASVKTGGTSSASDPHSHPTLSE